MNGKAKRIALCSADSIMMRSTADYLLETGTAERCVVFRRGEHLLRDLDRGDTYDCIVLDTMLVDMDATEVMMRLRALRLQTRPNIIVLVPPQCSFRMQRRIPGEVDSFLCKPLNPESLAQRIDLLCAEKQTNHEEDLLKQWGVALERTQVQYFTEAVQLLVRADKPLALRKELLSEVAENHCVSVSAVDSGLRRMIANLEEENTLGYQKFKKNNGLDGVRPTVKKLLEVCSRYARTVEQKEPIYAGR